MLERLDTDAFISFLNRRDEWIKTYNEIVSDYDITVMGLGEKWRGKGAEAFQKDAKKVRANLYGIQDILQTMCDTLQDCYEIIQECDKTLGELNEKAKQ